MSAQANASAGEVVVTGVVTVVEMLGSEQYVHVALAAGSLTARVPRDQPVGSTTG